MVKVEQKQVVLLTSRKVTDAHEAEANKDVIKSASNGKSHSNVIFNEDSISNETCDEKFGLKREIGFWGAMSYLVGSMIGKSAILSFLQLP